VRDAAGAGVGGATLRILQLRPDAEGQPPRFQSAEAACAKDGTFAWASPFMPVKLTAFAAGKGRATIELDDPELTALRRRNFARFRELEKEGGEEDLEEPGEDADSGGGGGAAPDAPGRLPVASDALELVLVAPARIHGRVLEGSRGVGGVRVVALSSGGGRFSSFDPHAFLDASLLTTLSGQDGAFEWTDASPGSYLIAAGGPDWCAEQIAGLETDGILPYLGPKGVPVGAGQAARVNVSVVPTATIEGQVLDLDGRPLADALVAAVLEAEEGVAPGPLLLGRLDMIVQTLTAGDGTYRLSGVPPDTRVRIAATGLDGSPACPSFRLGADDGASTWRSSLDRGPARAPGGQQARSPMCLLVERPSRTPSSDAVGGARTHRVASPSARSRRAPPSGPRPEPARPGDLRGRTLRAREPAAGDGGICRRRPRRRPGRPRGAGRRPPLETRFAFEDPSPTPTRRSAFGLDRAIRSRSVGADGRVEVECEKAGPSRLVASLRWQGEYYEGAEIVDAPADGVVLRLAPTRPGADEPRILVRAVGPDGKPVPSARFRVLSGKPGRPGGMQPLGDPRGGIVREGIGIEDLRHGFADPAATGSVWIDVFAARRGPATLPFGAVRAGPFPAGGGVREVALPPERRVVVRVLGPDGKGVRGGRASACDSPCLRTTHRARSSLSPDVASGVPGADGAVTLARWTVPLPGRRHPSDGFVVPRRSPCLPTRPRSRCGSWRRSPPW
jgi:hypothetical protein